MDTTRDNNLQGRMDSTIKFEKIKLIPPRKSSEQSVLSSLSLKSLINKNNNNNNNYNNNNNSDNSDNSNTNQSVRNSYRNHNQIQDSSFNSYNSHNNRNNNSINSNIGMKLPFGDTTIMNSTKDNTTKDFKNNNSIKELPEFENNSKITTTNTTKPNTNDKLKKSNNNNNNTNHINKVNDISMKQGYEDNTDINSNNDDSANLTQQALRKLSFLKMNNQDTITNNISSNTNSSNKPVNIKNDISNTNEIKQVSSFLNINNKASILRNYDKHNIINNTNNNTYNNPSHTNTFSNNTQNNIRNHSHSENEINKNLHTNGKNRTFSGSKSHLVKQINNPKKPLYVPAVLRNVSETNITNEDLQAHSNYNDLNHLIHMNNKKKSNTSSSIHSRSSSFFQNWIGISNHNTTSTSNKLPINNSHWVPDELRKNCKSCKIEFNFWERRHHCRHCGEIFCSKHLNKSIYLDANAKFIFKKNFNDEYLVKICDDCYNEFNKLKKIQNQNENNNDMLTFATQNNFQSNSNQNGKNINSIINRNNHANTNINTNNNTNNTRKDSIAGSVPVDWNWSSF